MPAFPGLKAKTVLPTPTLESCAATVGRGSGLFDGTYTMLQNRKLSSRCKRVGNRLQGDACVLDYTDTAEGQQAIRAIILVEGCISTIEVNHIVFGPL